VHILPRSSSAAALTGEGASPSFSSAIRKDVDLVLVPVTITDLTGRLVRGLDKDNFQIFEGKHRQEIRHFSNEDTPVSVGIILDTSGSMHSKLDRAREAVMEFCRTANPRDEFFLITFSDAPLLAVDFTSHVEDLEGALIISRGKGHTALLDAVYLGLAKMREAEYERRALLIISDGGDNRSRYTANEIKPLLKESDVQLYAAGIYDRDVRTEEELRGPQLLGELAGLTGGRDFILDNVNQLPAMAQAISVALRSQYVLAYQPENSPHDGKWHKIRVRLKIPHGGTFLHISAKNGYYAAGR